MRRLVLILIAAAGLWAAGMGSSVHSDTDLTATSLTMDAAGDFSFSSIATKAAHDLTVKLCPPNVAFSSASCVITFGESALTGTPGSGSQAHHITYSGNWGDGFDNAAAWKFWVLISTGSLNNYSSTVWVPPPEAFLTMVDTSGNLRYWFQGLSGQNYTVDLWTCTAAKTIPLSAAESGCSHAAETPSNGANSTTAPVSGSWDSSAKYYIYFRGPVPPRRTPGTASSTAPPTTRPNGPVPRPWPTTPP